MIIALLHKQHQDRLARDVRKVLGKGYIRRISLNPSVVKRPADKERGEEITKILELEKDPTQRIAEARQSIMEALEEIIIESKKRKIDAHLLVQQKEKLDREIQRTQNLIRSVLTEG